MGQPLETTRTSKRNDIHIYCLCFLLYIHVNSPDTDPTVSTYSSGGVEYPETNAHVAGRFVWAFSHFATTLDVGWYQSAPRRIEGTFYCQPCYFWTINHLQRDLAC